MQADVNLETGIVKAEFTLAEYREIIEALAARKGTKPVKPPTPTWPRLFEIPSDSDHRKIYAVRLWLDEGGYKKGRCTCPHNTFRHAWCKHLQRASVLLVRELAALS